MSVASRTPGSKPQTADSSQSMPSKKISPEELEKLTNRIYTQSMTQRQQKLQAIEAKVYRTEEPKKLSRSVIEASAARQATDEVERRKKRQEDLVGKFYKEADAKKLSPMEIDESVRRIYGDTMRIKSEKMQRLEDKYAFKPTTPQRKLAPEEVKATGERLCKPKKTSFTDDEVNELLGLH